MTVKRKVSGWKMRKNIIFIWQWGGKYLGGKWGKT